MKLIETTITSIIALGAAAGLIACAMELLSDSQQVVQRGNELTSQTQQVLNEYGYAGSTNSTTNVSNITTSVAE